MDIQNLFSVKDKIVFITGGATGVGNNIAEGFVSNGAKVYICSRSEEACKNAAQKLNDKGPGQCKYILGDVSTADGAKKIFNDFKKEEQKLDVLINNSGAAHFAPFGHWDEENYDKVMNTNLKGVFFVTQEFLPLLKAAASKESSARVIHIGSQNGVITRSLGMIPYDASKAGVHQMAKVMGSALSEHHINVNAIVLGLFRSNMTNDFIDTEMGIKFQKSAPIERHGYPEEIAGTCLWLASKAGGYTTGATIAVDGGGITGMKSTF